ncbi:MAG: hypothetical protein M1814_001965 [Vezdaea aestivalis]|nr:MAG: hypothetical protein M1814_001965 [Vezdaea aestivalis]
MSATPGMDNFGEAAAGGGIAGVALGVAATNERESGMEAQRAIDRAAPPYGGDVRGPTEREHHFNSSTSGDSAFLPVPAQSLQQQHSYSSTAPLGAAAAAPAFATPEGSLSRFNRDDMSLGSHPSQDRSAGDGHVSSDGPYNRYSNIYDPRMSQSNLGGIDPTSIADDNDDYLGSQTPQRRSVHNLGSSSPAAPAVAAGAAAGTGFLGGFFGAKRVSSSFNGESGGYGAVPADGTHDGYRDQKSEWLNEEDSARKKKRMIFIILGVLLLIGIIVGAIVGGILGARSGSSGGAGPSGGSTSGPPADDSKGDLNKNSAEIKKLLKNTNLHRVFPGMDYTPFNSQYPDCMSNPPSQNNVTRDVAVLSLLTKEIRLYGTDCNQTEMVLHAIKQLGLTDVKVWLGVWQEKNATTNKRQLDQMHNIIDKNGGDPFAGIIIGNEVLFRKEMTATELGVILSETRKDLAAKNIKLPVATSDLGDDWTADLASKTDIIMANIHPFFAGQTADQAAAWAINFWQQNDVPLAQAITPPPKNIISEIGWPSGGGKNCGQSLSCTSSTPGSVAGINEMNTFMNSFVCQALANGTNYFWFEAFDEPWKVRFNEAGKEWEDKWGLMDIGRNLKPGLKIPDCGGKTV